MVKAHYVLGGRIALPLLFCPSSAFLSPAVYASSFHHSSRVFMTGKLLVNTLRTATAVDWDNRIALQKLWSNSEKGWRVEVEWRNTPYGVGLFAAQDISGGTILRTGIIGCNLMQFTTVDDIQAFCEISIDEYDSRLRYVSDYLWGFTTCGTDEKGYLVNSHQDEENRFYGMWIPGNGLNHDENPNTVYCTTKDGIDLVALQHIESGSELYDDYRRHGQAPDWLLEFARDYQVATLNFPECNTFVNPDKY